MSLVELGNSFEFVRNGVSVKQEKNKGGIPITRIETIWNRTIDVKRVGFADIFQDNIGKYENYLLQSGDILMTHINSMKHLGKCAMYEEVPAKLIHGMNLLALRPKRNILFSKYAYYYFNTQVFNSIIQKISNQSVNHASFSSGNLKKIKIPLPPLAEQRKIAAILDEADKLRQLNKNLITKYDELTQSLFLDMFGDPVMNPMGWDIENLGHITGLITDGKHGNCNDEPGSGYYFVSAKDIRNNKINYSHSREIPKEEFEEVDKRTNLQPGDLVMINTGATIGRMAIAKDIDKTRRSTFQKSVAIIKVKQNLITSIFLQYVFQLRLEVFANKGSGSAIKNLLLSEMRRFRIIVPPIALQNQFAERVEKIESQKAQAQESLLKAEELFGALLQRCFGSSRLRSMAE